MRPPIISCTDQDWKNVVRHNLAEGHELDLVNFNDLDMPYCEQLAREYGMRFVTMPEHKAIFFKIMPKPE